MSQDQDPAEDRPSTLPQPHEMPLPASLVGPDGKMLSQEEIFGDTGDRQRLPRWFWRGVVAIAFSVLVFMGVLYTLGRLTSLIGMIGIALFVSFAVEPAVNLLARKGWRRGPATLFCFFIIFGVGGLFAGLMVSMFVDQVSDLAKEAPGYIDSITEWINENFDTEITNDELNRTVREYQSDLAGLAADMGGRALTITGTAVGILFQMFTVFLFSYFMISQGPTMRRNLCSLLPRERQFVVLRLWELAIQKTGGWVYSRVILALICALSSWLVFVIIGIPSPLAMALWVGLVSQFIPVIGTYLGGALPILVGVIDRPISAVWVLVWIIVYQQIENYVLSPKITSQTMDLHPAVAFGSALGGASLFGPMGAVLALPAAAVIQAFISTYLERYEVIQSDLLERESESKASKRETGHGDNGDDAKDNADGASVDDSEDQDTNGSTITTEN